MARRPNRTVTTVTNPNGNLLGGPTPNRTTTSGGVTTVTNPNGNLLGGPKAETPNRTVTTVTNPNGNLLGGPKAGVSPRPAPNPNPRPNTDPPNANPNPQPNPPAPATGLGAAVGTFSGNPTDPSDPRFTGRADSTFDLVNEYANTDSAMMTAARARGFESAASRGMLNSSMAAGAAEAAALDYVVPIASQDAQQEFQKNLSGLGTQQNLILARFDRRTQRQLLAATNRFEARQNQLDRNQEIRVLNRSQSFEERMTQTQNTWQANQNQLDRIFKAEESEVDRAFQGRQNRLERQLRTFLSGSDLSANDRNAANTIMNNAFTNYNSMVSNILQNPSLSAEERKSQINAAQDLLGRQVEYTSELYDTAFDWPDNVWMDTTAGGGGGGGDDVGGAPVVVRN